MSDADDPGIVEGLAAIAITVAEMGGDDGEVRTQVLSMMARLRVDDPAQVLRAAARAVSQLPTPIEESADDTERQREVRRLLGVTPAEDQLVAALRGRDVLEKLAREFDKSR